MLKVIPMRPFESGLEPKIEGPKLSYSSLAWQLQGVLRVTGCKQLIFTWRQKDLLLSAVFLTV